MQRSVVQFDMQVTEELKRVEADSTLHSPDAHMDVFEPEIKNTHKIATQNTSSHLIIN